MAILAEEEALVFVFVPPAASQVVIDVISLDSISDFGKVSLRPTTKFPYALQEEFWDDDSGTVKVFAQRNIPGPSKSSSLKILGFPRF